MKRLKEAMITAIMLAMTDFHKQFIETDPSGYGLGAFMMQDHLPSAFYNMILGPRARGKSIYEKELCRKVKTPSPWTTFCNSHRATKSLLHHSTKINWRRLSKVGTQLN